MAGGAGKAGAAGAAADRGSPGPGKAGGKGPGAGPDWAGLPADLLVKVAETLVAQTEAGWAAQLKSLDPMYWTEARIQAVMARRKCEGNCLFVFALVCKGWRKAQLEVGGPLRTRVHSDVVMLGRVALAKWALAEGCPREHEYGNMAHAAATSGNLELVQWLCGEGGFEMDEGVMADAATSGNLQLVQWLWGEGCPWDDCSVCELAVEYGHVEVLRWVRENGAWWTPFDRDRAAEELGYTDDLGNLVETSSYPNSSDDEYGYEDALSDDE